MRKIKTLLLVGLTFLFAAEGFAQRGIGTNLPDRSSVLHLESETRGLLIPQINLTNGTLDAAPVVNPASSLLIYNTSDQNDVRPGYYYWDTALNGGAGAWAALLDSNSAGENIKISPDGTISIDPGADAGKVLVTVDEGAGPISKWVDISTILGDLLGIEGDNGILVTQTIDAAGLPLFTVKLDGILTEDTTINTNAGKFTVNSNENKFEITNLAEVTVDDDGNIDTTTEAFADTFDVLIVGVDGLVQKVNVESLLKNAVAVANGLTYDPTDGKIKLGGDLIKETTIKLDGNDFVIDASPNMDDADNPEESNFKVIGLEEVNAANKIMVVDANNNVRTVTRVISKDIDAPLDMSGDLSTTWPEYSPYVQEVNINVTSLVAETDLVLPEAIAANEGQVINISLTIGSESGNYLNIKKNGTTQPDNSNVLTWGALPHQGWVLKSNGSDWLIVSSN